MIQETVFLSSTREDPWVLVASCLPLSPLSGAFQLSCFCSANIPTQPHLLLVTCSMNQHLLSALFLLTELPLSSHLCPFSLWKFTSFNLWTWPGLRILWPRWGWTSDKECLPVHSLSSMCVSVWFVGGKGQAQWFLQTNWRPPNTCSFSRCLGLVWVSPSERTCSWNTRFKLVFETFQIPLL